MGSHRQVDHAGYAFGWVDFVIIMYLSNLQVGFVRQPTLSDSSPWKNDSQPISGYLDTHNVVCLVKFASSGVIIVIFMNRKEMAEVKDHPGCKVQRDDNQGAFKVKHQPSEQETTFKKQKQY